MGTNCTPLVADLFLFCYERDFMLSLSDNNQADIFEAFNSTSRYTDGQTAPINNITVFFQNIKKQNIVFHLPI